RLVPLLFSIASLFLFYFVAIRCLSDWAAPIALLMFAAGSQLIYFSAQVKQYSSDVAIALAILLIGFELLEKDLTVRKAILLALAGATVVWFSHPSVLVLAGTGTTLAVDAMLTKSQGRKTRFWRLALAIACWLLSFTVFYSISLRNLSSNNTLEG